MTAQPLPAWTSVPGYTDIVYSKAAEGIARIVINRPEVRNAFRPETVRECEGLRETYGEEPAAWLPHFCGWTIPEATDA